MQRLDSEVDVVKDDVTKQGDKVDHLEVEVGETKVKVEDIDKKVTIAQT